MASLAPVLHDFAQASVAQLAGTGALLGVLFHISIIRLEFEPFMFHFIALSVLAFFGLTYAFSNGDGFSMLSGLGRTSLFFTSFNISVLTSIGTYRLLFHRCRKFPGPLGLKISRFYSAYLWGKGSPFYKELGRMHEKYGDIVRTGPRELSVLSPAAIPLIYGPNTECLKGMFYTQGGHDPDKVAINMMRDVKGHKMRRRAWDRGLSNKAVTMYEPRVKEKTDLFIEQLRSNAGKPMDIAKWSIFFGFDVMGAVGFSTDFNNLTSGVEHPGISQIHKHMSIYGVTQTLPWLMHLLSAIPGAASGFFEFFNFCEEQIEEQRKSYSSEKNPENVASWLLKAVIEKDVSASPTAQSLTDDSRTLIIAGSDTTANTLANALFYLTANPAKQSKLQDLLDRALPEGPSTWSYEQIKTVTYIDDIINEVLRLKPPVIHGPPRQTPSQGFRVDDVYIPGNVDVTIPCYLIQRDPRYWKHPNDFIPERFGERREELGTDGAPWFPFMLGAHTCLGKGLAYMVLRTSISLIVQNFSTSFAPGETGETFDSGFLDHFIMVLPPLQLRFTPRN